MVEADRRIRTRTTAMIASAHPSRFRIGTYTNGQPYSAARGRYAPRERVEDRLATSHAVVNLPVEQPTPGRFLEVIIRELKIRFYQPKTVKAYRNALAGFLRWAGRRPHQLTREDVREYLELLVDGGGSASWVLWCSGG